MGDFAANPVTDVNRLRENRGVDEPRRLDDTRRADDSRRLDDRPREEFSVVRPTMMRVAWGPILAAAAVAIGVQLLFTALGAAIGASATDASDIAVDAARDGARGMTIAAGAWWLITGTVALLIGGLVLGRVAGIPRSSDLHLHAVTMWAVTAIFGFFVLWSGAGIAGVAGSNASDTTANVGRAALGNDTGTRNLGTNDPELRATAPGIGSDGTPAVRTSAGEITTGDVEETRQATRNTSWYSVIALLLGIAASVLGAWMSANDRVLARPMLPTPTV